MGNIIIRDKKTGALAQFDEDTGQVTPLPQSAGPPQFAGSPIDPTLKNEITTQVTPSAPIKVRDKETGALALFDENTGKITPLSPSFEANQQPPIPGQPAVPFLANRPGPGKTPLEFLGIPGEVVGHAVQKFVDPRLGGTAADIAGAVTQEGVNFFLPGAVAKKGQRITKFLGAHLPGSQAARMEGAIESTQGILADKIAKAKAFFQSKAAEVGKISEFDKVPATKIQQTLDGIIARGESHTTAAAGDAVSYAKDLKAKLEGLGNAPNLHWLDTELTAVGERTRALASKGEYVDPQYSKIFKSIVETLESKTPQKIRMTPGGTQSVQTLTPQASLVEKGTQLTPMSSGPPLRTTVTTTTPRPPKVSTGSQDIGYPIEQTITPSGAGSLIRQKDIAYRQQAGLKDAQKIFDDLVKTKRGLGGAQDVNANQVLDKMHKNKFLMDSLPAQDAKDLEVIFSKMADLPALPPPKGAMPGAGRFAGTASAGALAAHAMGADPATAGFIGGSLGALADLSRYLLPNRTGRKVLRAVLESGPIDQNKINMLTAVARGITGQNLAPQEGQ